MQRLSEESLSPPPPVPQGSLGSPAPDEGPPRSQPASLSVLYRSAFAQDCEAIALQLQAALEDSGWPEPPPASRLRCASTIEAETLTPLGPSCSFFSEARRTPAQDAWPPSSELPQPPGNRTYECHDEASAGPSSLAGSCATYLCEESSRLSTASLASTAGARFSLATEDNGRDDSAARRRTYEWELPAAAGEDGPGPLVTSTPLLTGAQRLAQPARGSTPRSAPGEQAGPPKLGSGRRTSRGPVQGASVLRKKLVSTATAKRSALPTRKKGLAPEAGPGVAPAGTSLRGAAAALPIPRGAGAELRSACLQSSAVPGTSAGCNGQSQTLAKKQLPVEMKKTLTKLPCFKTLPLSVQPPSKLTRGSIAGAAGDNKIAKARAQKRPQEKPSDPVSTQKHPFLKRVYQGKGQTEKPTSEVLPAAGQICRATSGTGSAASCLECPRLLEENQRLLEENKQLKIMLDKYRHK